MAVRHGYGKVAGTDALVFAYDTGDTRNSYRGEPTTNLITDTSDFGNTFWNQKSGTFTANDAVGPRGIQNAAKIVAVNTDPYIYSSAVVTVTAGSVTWSIWVKGAGNTIGKSAEARINFSGTASGTDNNVSVTLTDQWQLLQVSATATGGGTIKFGLEAPNGAVSGDIMYFADPMFEQKSHATPFVNGTRSATQGLLDITGNSTIDISPTSFNSNAEIEYDGSNDYIYVGSKSYSFPNGATVEQVIKPITLNRNQGFFTLNNYSAGSYINFWMPSSNVMRWEVIGTTSQGYSTITTTTAFQTGQYYHVVGTFNGTTTNIYLNGVLENSQTMTNQPTSITTQMDIGRYAGDYPSSAQIPVTKFYTRPLTAQEVLNNYNFYKGRFGM